VHRPPSKYSHYRLLIRPNCAVIRVQLQFMVILRVLPLKRFFNGVFLILIRSCGGSASDDILLLVSANALRFDLGCVPQQERRAVCRSRRTYVRKLFRSAATTQSFT
jgi:hypothetical protein